MPHNDPRKPARRPRCRQASGYAARRLKRVDADVYCSACDDVAPYNHRCTREAFNRRWRDTVFRERHLARRRAAAARIIRSRRACLDRCRGTPWPDVAASAVCSRSHVSELAARYLRELARRGYYKTATRLYRRLWQIRRHREWAALFGGREKPRQTRSKKATKHS